MARVQLASSAPGSWLAGSVNRRPMVRVYTKPTWDGDWQPAHFLWPLQATVNAGPLKSSATFEWLVGRVKNADSTTFGVQHDAPLKDTYVKIVRLADQSAADSVLWLGRIAETEIDYHGVTQTDTGAVPRGRRIHTALGLENELDRNAIRGSWITNDDTSAVFVDTPLRFNEKYDGPSGLNQIGNRSSGTVEHPDNSTLSSYVFAGRKGSTVSTPQPWTVADILNYLLTFYAPRELGLTLSGNTEPIEQLVLPKIDLSGRTVFQALDYLVDRRRGIGWCVRILPDGKATIHVYTIFDEPVTFDAGGDTPSTGTIPANYEKQPLDLDNLGHLVDDNSLQLDTLYRYGKIVVSGARVLVCFTAKVLENLFAGWTATEETAYVTCDGTNGGQDQAAVMNDEARGDVKLDHVFSHFHLGDAPQSGGGSGTVVNAGGPFKWRATGGNANPKVDDAGRIKVGDTPQAPVRDWGHRVERHLPFQTVKTVADADPEYERPFVILQSPTTGRYVLGHSTGVGQHCRLTPLDNHFGIAVEFTPHHRLARGHWPSSATPTVHDPSQSSSSFDYTTMQATIAVRTDARLQVTEVLDKDGPLKDRVLHIEIPDAELHYAVPGTIKSIKPSAEGGDSRELVTKDDAIIRDDGDRLRRIAAMAKAWFGKERNVVSVTVNALWQQYPVGSLLTSLVTSSRFESKEINTPVSQVIYNLVDMRTTIRTNWAELDVTIGHSAGRKRT